MVELFGKKFAYKGNLALLQKKKVSIVGSRRPMAYSKALAHKIASGFASRGWVVVSGGAMGIDAIAHRGAGVENSILVLPCGIDRVYPKVNRKLIEEVAQKGLLLSQFDNGFEATPWSFVVRNEIVVRLGDFLIVVEAQRDSGSIRSAEYAKKYNKRIYVPAHRIGESEGSNDLAKRKEAEVIWDVEKFLDGFGRVEQKEKISGLLYEEALERFGDKLVELELLGKVTIREGRVYYKEEE